MAGLPSRVADVSLGHAGKINEVGPPVACFFRQGCGIKRESLTRESIPPTFYRTTMRVSIHRTSQGDDPQEWPSLGYSRAAGDDPLAEAGVRLELHVELFYHGRRAVIVVVPAVHLAVNSIVHPVLPRRYRDLSRVWPQAGVLAWRNDGTRHRFRFDDQDQAHMVHRARFMCGGGGIQARLTPQAQRQRLLFASMNPVPARCYTFVSRKRKVARAHVIT